MRKVEYTTVCDLCGKVEKSKTKDTPKGWHENVLTLPVYPHLTKEKSYSTDDCCDECFGGIKEPIVFQLPGGNRES